MRILFLTTSVSRQGAGVTAYIIDSARALTKAGCEVKILTLSGVHEDDLPEDLDIVLFERHKLVGSYGYSKDMHDYALKNCNDFDIIQTHIVWNYQLLLGLQLSKKMNKPLICSIHGMLEPWCLSNSKIKKQIAKKLYVYKSLKRAECLHVTANQELYSIRQYGLNNPVSVLPIGIYQDDYNSVLTDSIVFTKWPTIKNKKVILFVSRISPKKGLVNLAKVWGYLSKEYKDWHLIIAGPDYNGHQEDVNSIICKESASQQTTFTGPVYGQDKINLYAACDVFVLPTFSENFGIVISEALAAGKPVITTKGAPWKDLIDYKCGWWIDIGVEPLENALKNAMDATDEERKEMGIRGRKLVEEKYSWPQIASDMIDVYKWVLGEGDKPECVRLD